MSRQQIKQAGFTIIEVVLVLAIAALIFLMVFIALPALQASQRDTQRRTDAGRFVTQLQSYATNNRGALPTNDNIGTFVTNYLRSSGQTFASPKTGDNYAVEAGTGQPTTVDTFYYSRGGTCNGETIVAGSSTRQAAVAVKLEGSGVFCQQVQQG